MPKVSPLRLLIGGSPKASKRDHVQDEHSSSCPRPSKIPEAAATTPRVRRGSSYATVYPHSENVPENLITPERRTKGKLSWYQRQVKNLDGESKLSKNPSQSSRTPRSVKVDKEASTGSSSVQDSAVTPRKAAARALRYCQPGVTVGSLVPTTKLHESSVAAEHFDLEEDSSFWLEHNVQVLIRIRPLNSQEVATRGYERCIRQESAHSITWTGTPDTRFTFDHVACESISQEKLFRVAGMPMVENCMRGYNSCVFAYGQTGSGKTHTMLGDISPRSSEDRGLTTRVFEHLFETIRNEEELRRDEMLKYTCKCSFLEIYNEQITDLLDPSLTNLQVREDARRGVYVESLTEIEVTCIRDVTTVLLQGASNRKVAATNMNRESSRSHSVLTCVVESKWEGESVTNRRFARLNLVDLAGSERQKSTGAENDRLKEAVNINKSLSTLGLVIMVLVDVANGKQRHVPYRDSKLTFLLQDSLGGNSKTMIISTVSPSISCAMDTLSTLKFAQRAKFICNNAIVNEDTSRDVNVLRQQIHRLKEEVNRLRNQTVSSSDEYDTDITSVHSERPKRRDINKMLSAEFMKLNQLRESLEAELETKPYQSDSYQRKLQDYNLENQKLRGKITDLESMLEKPSEGVAVKEKELQKEIENHSKNMTELEVLLKESEEKRISQATSIRNLELSINDYRAEVRDLKSQLKEGKDVQEQMESQQVFLIGEFETILEEHNKLTDKLVKTEAREQAAKDQLRLLNWELKKKNELYDLEKELQTRASAENLLGYVDRDETAVLEDKLRKTRKELDEARSRYRGEEASRLAREKEMDITRSEVEAETANALASMNRELVVVKEECKAANDRVMRLMGDLEESSSRCKALAEENTRLVSVVQDRDLEIQELHEQYDDATAKLFDYLSEGDRALVSAAKEMEDIIQESFSTYSSADNEQDLRNKHFSIEALQSKLHQAFTIAKDAENKIKAYSEQQKCQATETDQLQAELQGTREKLRVSERNSQVAILVLRHLQRQGVQGSSSSADWRREKEELLAEVTEAKLEAAAKCRETATVLQKFKDSQHMLKEAEQLLNALVKANESAKSSAWRDDIRKSVSQIASLPEKEEELESKLNKAKRDLHIIKQELGTFTLEGMHAITDAEQEVQSTMRSMEETMREMMSSVFSFNDCVKDEFVELRGKMAEVTEEVGSLLEETRRKNDVLKGLEYDISLLQEAFSEAHEKKLELQDENERMQEELEQKTSEISGAEAELLKLLNTLTTVEAELRSLKETTSYLSAENRTQKKQLEGLEANNTRLEEELEVKKRLVESLESELLEVSSLVESEIGSPHSRVDSNAALKESDELYAELVTARTQLENSRALIDELEMVAEKSRQVAEKSQAQLGEKEEEVKVLERSVQELESTISTMENQISLLKRDGDVHRLAKEDLEMEVQRLRSEISKAKSFQTGDSAGIPADRIKLLRLEEELESVIEQCRLKDAQISSLRKHVSELMDTAAKEACAYRRKIRRLEASLETRCTPKSSSHKAADRSKGSGSPFKCMGLALSSDELNTNKRRVEELEAAASVREKEVFMLNAKLAQAESMTYDVVRDLLEVKHEISSFVQTDERNL